MLKISISHAQEKKEHISITSPSHGYINVHPYDPNASKPVTMSIWINSLNPLTNVQIIRKQWSAEEKTWQAGKKEKIGDRVEETREKNSQNNEKVKQIELEATSWFVTIEFTPYSFANKKFLIEEQIQVLAMTDQGMKKETFIFRPKADGSGAGVLADRNKISVEFVDRGDQSLVNGLANENGFYRAVASTESEEKGKTYCYLPGYLGTEIDNNLNKASETETMIPGLGGTFGLAWDCSGSYGKFFLYTAQNSYSKQWNTYKSDNETVLQNSQTSIWGAEIETMVEWLTLKNTYRAGGYYVTRGLFNEAEQPLFDASGKEEKNRYFQVILGSGSPTRPDEVTAISSTPFALDFSYKQFYRDHAAATTLSSPSLYSETGTTTTQEVALYLALSPSWSKFAYATINAETEGSYMSYDRTQFELESRYYNGYFQVGMTAALLKTQYREIRNADPSALKTELRRVNVDSALKLSRHWSLFMGVTYEDQISVPTGKDYQRTAFYLAFGWTTLSFL